MSRFNGIIMEGMSYKTFIEMNQSYSGYQQKYTNMGNSRLTEYYSLPISILSNMCVGTPDAWSRVTSSPFGTEVQFGTKGYLYSGEADKNNPNSCKFNKIETDKQYAIDFNKNGIVDKGEIFSYLSLQDGLNSTLF